MLIEAGVGGSRGGDVDDAVGVGGGGRVVGELEDVAAGDGRAAVTGRHGGGIGVGSPGEGGAVEIVAVGGCGAGHAAQRAGAQSSGNGGVKLFPGSHWMLSRPERVMQ